MTIVRTNRAAAAGDLETRVEPDPAPLRRDCEAFRAASRSTIVLGRSLSDWQVESRAAIDPALAQPDAGPLILTGHQAGIWHAGILSKWLLTEAIADAWGGRSAAILVEHDVNDAGLIVVPALVRDEDGTRLIESPLSIRGSRRQGPTAILRPIQLEGLSGSNASIAELTPRIERLVAAVNAHADRPSLAAQMAAANDALLSGVMRTVPRQVGSLALLKTPFGEALVKAMRDDPERCIAAYNSALAEDPQAARALRPGELPLWSLADSDRRPVMASDPHDRPQTLAPRAFLMTAIARAVLADCFVHGTGGGRYERVTERWMREWLGVELAPMVVATATVRLPLEALLPPAPDAAMDGAVLSAADLHRMRFDPDGQHDGAPSPTKAALLAAIHAAPPRSAERRGRYRALMSYLAERRTVHGERLERLAVARASMRSRAHSLEVARSRVWPWPLHATERLVELADAMRARVGGQRIRNSS
jgi:hypothetical protein